MNNKDVTIIICCAGMGGKALVNVLGKPIIIRQLELLNEYDDVRIVIGLHAESLIDVVTKYRKDVMFVFDRDYINNGVATSISKGMINCRQYVVSIDGDTLVDPKEFLTIMEYPSSCICGTKPVSKESLYLKINDNGLVCSFCNERTDIEWGGINKFEAQKVDSFRRSFTEMLDSLFPLPLLNIHARKIEMMEDYDKMSAWVEKGYSD